MLQNPERGFPAALARYQPKIVAIYEDHFNFLSKMCLSRMRQVAYKMMNAACAANATVVLNGPDFSDHVEEYLERGADYVLLGEAEWTLLELARALLLESRQDPEDIPGVTFVRRGTSTVFRTNSRPVLRDLDTLPLPARDLVDMDSYREAWRDAHGSFSLNLVASRGCPYRCNWCSRPIYGESFHVRSAASVADEMQELRESYGAEHLWFADDIFGLKHSWMTDFADAVQSKAASLPFKIQSRVNLITSETASALRRAGCSEVWMGVESGSQKILDAMEKGTQIDQVRIARENLRREGIRACFFLQFGYPGETWEDIDQTIQLIRHTRPDDIGVSVSYPLPGTKFYTRVQEELGEQRNWFDSDDLSLMFKGAYTNEFYRALRDALHAEVNAWTSSTGNTAAPRTFRGVISARSGRVTQLWDVVRRLEKTCRNPEPTLASCTRAV
jgi:radical SAM superfamily enzyme YgiQ (UPF0313 family)